MDTKEHKKLFEDFFLKTLSEQSLIRNEMLGHKIVSIHYAPKVDGWDIEIKDEGIIHVPMGFVTFKLSNGNYYRINTNYQSWCGGIFGVLLQKLEEEEFTKNKYDLDRDYFNENKIWEIFKDTLIKKVSWNWKTEPQEPHDGKRFNLNQVNKHLFEDCFIPESLIFEFENQGKVYFFGLEPDAKIPSNETYSLISGGEELMIFLNDSKLEKWNLKNIGFEILENN